MQHHKAYKLILLILAATLLLSGCRENVAFILPAEAAGDTILTTRANTVDSSTDDRPSAVTVPTTIPTDPTEGDTVEPPVDVTDPT